MTAATKAARGAAKSSKKAVSAAASTIDAAPLAVESIQMAQPQAALAVVQPRVTTIAAQALLLKITDAPSEQAAASMLLEVQSVEKVLKEKLESVTRPLNEALKNVRSIFKPAQEQLEKVNAQLRSNILGYRQMAFQFAEQQRLEAAKKADAAAAKGDNRAALAFATEAVSVQAPARVVQASAAVSAAASNIRFAQVASRKRWTFELEALNKVPRQYLELNEKAVRAAISSGVRKVDGLRIFEEDQLAVGGR